MPADTSASSDADANSGYDRDAIVASMTRYYTVLSKMVSIDLDDIALPHNGRRPDSKIPLAKLRRLGFNDRMIDFVRHVPFVLNGLVPVFPDTDVLIYYHSHFDRYPEEDYQRDDPIMVNMWPRDEKMTEGVLPLSRQLHSAQYGTWWMLDTNNDEVPEGEQWRSSRPVPAVAYFDGLCEDLKSLRLIPLTNDTNNPYWEMWEDVNEKEYPNHYLLPWIKEAKAIYHQCHWPDLRNFQRAKCRRLLIDMRRREKEYYDEIDKEKKREQQLASGEESLDGAQTPPVPKPESPPRRAPWGTESIEIQTKSDGMFVTTTFKI
ncbi:hypothetical protein J4E91_006865 [Alternaria rosae]|nr:hypothetical protein J4E91_006865 [Alternaria rosae]